MNLNYVRVALGLSALAVCIPAHAGFINGGFEKGNFTGWTIEYGLAEWHFTDECPEFPPPYVGSMTVLSSPNGHQSVVGALNDPLSPFVTPFEGNYTARLNNTHPYNTNAGNHVSRISQTAIMGAGETNVYAKWAGAMEWHGGGNQAFVQASISVNGQIVADEQSYWGQWPDPYTPELHFPSDWTLGEFFNPDNESESVTLRYKSGVLQVTNLQPGDAVTVSLLAMNCPGSDHVGFAYLDGVRTNHVPDGAAAALLFLMSGLPLAMAARKRR